jgi:hypothetical protein
MEKSGGYLADVASHRRPKRAINAAAMWPRRHGLRQLGESASNRLKRQQLLSFLSFAPDRLRVDFSQGFSA